MADVLPAAQRGSLIRVLPDRVANQIAAGEVVERPVAVVKELVENSLDAGATRVEIEFRQGGKRLIRVEDNGHGMSPDDAMLAIERHATSKIREADDLNSIQSFGFRGEALPSIASVSRFRLRTRAEGWEHGTEVVVNGGRHVETREVGMPVGTCIEVSHLFNSVPARRKFLKTDKTEAAHITQLCRLLAIAHPEVSFALTEDGRRVFQSPVCPSLQDRIGEIFGRNICQDLIELGRELPHMKLKGLIGRPGVGRSTRQDLICYVNNRPVDSRTLTYALIEGYHTYIPKGRYPLAFLFLDIEPRALDVNVHPAKREVRFRDEGGVRRFVIEALLETLDRAARGEFGPTQNNSAVVKPEEKAPVVTPRPAPAPQPEEAKQDGVSRAAKLLKERGLEVRPATPPPRPAAPKAEPKPESKPSQGQPAAPEKLRRWRFLGAAHGDYALFESPDGIVCMNRRGAQVRVLYEDFLNSLETGKLARQALLFPITFELDPLLADVLETHAAFFRENGFELEAFGGRMFRVEAVPAWFESGQCEDFVRDAVALIDERGIRPGEDAQLARQAFARLAASRAARIPATANEQEMMGLLRRLLACNNPVADPSGKPTFFELPKSELARRFGQP